MRIAFEAEWFYLSPEPKLHRNIFSPTKENTATWLTRRCMLPVEIARFSPPGSGVLSLHLDYNIFKVSSSSNISQLSHMITKGSVDWQVTPGLTSVAFHRSQKAHTAGHRQEWQ